MARTKVYFASDVHLGLQVGDPSEREHRFVAFLRDIRCEDTAALYLLGDIWDFWYEYRDVVPKQGARVVSALIELMDAGIEVFYLPGNHDIWCYSFFEQLGMKKIVQPHICTIGGSVFCLGHGDGLGGAKFGYRVCNSVFHSPVAQWFFSLLHPWVAFRFGNFWSKGNRGTHKPYVFGGDEEPLVRFSKQMLASEKVDFFVFGHYHAALDRAIGSSSRLIVLGDWIAEGSRPYAVFDIADGRLTASCGSLS